MAGELNVCPAPVFFAALEGHPHPALPSLATPTEHTPGTLLSLPPETGLGWGPRSDQNPWASLARLKPAPWSSLEPELKPCHLRGPATFNPSEVLATARRLLPLGEGARPAEPLCCQAQWEAEPRAVPGSCGAGGGLAPLDSCTAGSQERRVAGVSEVALMG